MISNPRYVQTKRITLIGAWCNTFLGFIKIIVGYLGYSQALIADGIHSLSDLVTDFLVLFAAKFGSKQPDLDHPYGHGRIETVATVLVAIILILVGLGIVYEAFVHLLEKNPNPPLPKISVIVIAILGILVKEYLFHYTLKVANKIESNLLRASAWHHRSDVLSSFIVLVGIVGARLGWHFLDALAAMVMAVLILKMGAEMIWSSLRELVDTGVDLETLDKIRKQIVSVPGVKSLHQLRTRSIAGAIFVDIHILVDPKISVSEGHFISDQVHLNLDKSFNKIADVIVHIDPEDDEKMRPSLNLPKRYELEKKCQARWENLPGFDQIEKITLHYLSGKLELEIVLPLEILSKKLSAANLTQQYQEAVKDFNFIAQVRLYFV
jgi:cation diffusion facilitator family transporter